MDYKAEVMVGRKVIFSMKYNNYSHPNQIARILIDKFKKRFDYFTIFIMNKYGEVWSFGVEKTNNKYKAWQLSNEMKSKRDVIMVFSGNITIAELMMGGA